MPAFEKAFGNAVENRFVENLFEIHLEIICESFFMPAFEKAIGNAVGNQFYENRFEVHLEIICESFFMQAFETAIGNAVENLLPPRKASDCSIIDNRRRCAERCRSASVSYFTR